LFLLDLLLLVERLLERFLALVAAAGEDACTRRLAITAA
jgi:hypothetical protein